VTTALTPSEKNLCSLYELEHRVGTLEINLPYYTLNLAQSVDQEHFIRIPKTVVITFTAKVIALNFEEVIKPLYIFAF
jgi:hypothetical protein